MTDLTPRPDATGSPLPWAVGLDLTGRVIVTAADGWVVAVLGPADGPGDAEARVVADAHRIVAGARAMRAFDRLAADVRNPLPPEPDPLSGLLPLRRVLDAFEANTGWPVETAPDHWQPVVTLTMAELRAVKAAVLAAEGATPAPPQDPQLWRLVAVALARRCGVMSQTPADERFGQTLMRVASAAERYRHSPQELGWARQLYAELTGEQSRAAELLAAELGLPLVEGDASCL